MESQIKQLQQYVDGQEICSRKYNLLFYGKRKDDEDTTEVVPKCLESNLRIPEEEANDNIIQNSHRIPKNLFNKYNPEVIIVEFAKWQTET